MAVDVPRDLSQTLSKSTSKRRGLPVGTLGRFERFGKVHRPSQSEDQSEASELAITEWHPVDLSYHEVI